MHVMVILRLIPLALITLLFTLYHFEKIAKLCITTPSDDDAFELINSDYEEISWKDT